MTTNLTREQLMAALTSIGEHECLTLDPDDVARYFDWSTRNDDGTYRLEVGDKDGDFVVVDMSRDELVRLTQTLTLHLLATDERADVAALDDSSGAQMTDTTDDSDDDTNGM